MQYSRAAVSLNLFKSVDVSRLLVCLMRVASEQVAELQCGPLQSGALSVDCGVTWRQLSASGPGINTNYLMDISPEWRNPGGPTFDQALKVTPHRAIESHSLTGASHAHRWSGL